MCTVLFVKTFKDFKGDRDINPLQWTRWLAYRGRDKYQIAIFDGRSTILQQCDTMIDVTGALSRVRGEALIAIFGRATPETEEDSNQPLKQPIIFTDPQKGDKFVGLHHGLYENAPPDAYDSEELFKLLVNDSRRFLYELRYHSSFVIMVAPATALARKITAYVGQLPFAFEDHDKFVIMGTIQNPVAHHHVYTTIRFTFDEKSWNIESVEPLDPNGIETAYTSTYIPFDTVLLPRYSTCRIMSLFSGGMDCLISTYYMLQKMKTLNTNVTDLYLLFYDYGQFAKNEELEATKSCAEYFQKVFDVNTEIIVEQLKFPRNPLVDQKVSATAHHQAESDTNYVPMRNLVMISHAATLCEQLGVQVLVSGFNLSEGMTYNDNSPSFYYNIAGALQCAGKRGYRLSFIAPLLHLTKTEAVRYALRQKIELHRSWSCYYPQNGKPCGQCGSCLLREQAIKRAKQLL